MNPQQLQQKIGQIESTIKDVEDSLDEEEFKEYCDAAYTCITYLRMIKNRKV